jgi:predicted solute-binding protein
MPDEITVAVPPSLSARPLVVGLEGRAGVRLVSAPWQSLAALLRGGECDAALLPSVDYPRIAADVERARTLSAGVRQAPRHFVILPVPAITSRGAVGAMKLVGYAEKDKLRRVLLDPASPTGNALVHIFVQRQLKVRPHFVYPEEVGLKPPRSPDAELVAGDRALAADFPRAAWDTDLGAEWHRMTYLPMVYAMWVARADGDLARLTAVIGEAAAAGLETRESIAARAAEQSQATPEVLRRFLLEQTRYVFGPKEQQGLEVFLDMAADERLVPEGVALVVADRV